MRHFQSWVEKYRVGKFVRLQRGDEWCFVRAVSRFQLDYRRRLRRKLRVLQDVRWRIKLEFTVDPKKFYGWSLLDEWKWIRRAWAKFRRYLRKMYGKFRFLQVVEAHRSGRPHLHVLLADIEKVPVEVVRSLWQKYGG